MRLVTVWLSRSYQAMFKPGLDGLSHGVGRCSVGRPSLWSRRIASSFCFTSVLVFRSSHRDRGGWTHPRQPQTRYGVSSAAGGAYRPGADRHHGLSLTFGPASMAFVLL